MGLLTRFVSIFQSSANEFARQLEDPRASLNFSLARLEENRRVLRRGLVEVSAARQRITAQRDRTAAAVPRYEAQASTVLKAGREDLARRALERKQQALDRQAELESHLDHLAQQEGELKENLSALDEKIDSLRSKNEELKSIFMASQAQLRLREILSGVSVELSDVSSAVHRAEARIQEMQSRTRAIENLLDEGVLVDVLGEKADDVDRELSRMRRSQAVEEELAQLKAEAATP